MTVEVGTLAPDFELSDQHGQTVRLSDLRGHKAVVLVFYPFAFTGVCSGELHALQDERPELDNGEVALLAVSTDSMYSLRVFAEKEGFEFAMLSDFWPHGEVAAAYGVLNEAVGAAMRGTFVIDRNGVVRWTVLHGLGEARDIEEYKKALAEL